MDYNECIVSELSHSKLLIENCLRTKALPRFNPGHRLSGNFNLNLLRIKALARFDSGHRPGGNYAQNFPTYKNLGSVRPRSSTRWKSYPIS